MKTKANYLAVTLVGGILAGGITLPFMQAATAAPEPPRGPIEVKLTAYKVVAQGEKEALQSAEKMKPGEIIEYQAQYLNNGGKAIRNLAATVPIPESLEFLPGTASPTGATASTDGKTFAPPPLKRISKMANGGTTVEFVLAGEYRFLRWNVGELGAGKTVQVSARARMLGPVKKGTAATNDTAAKGGAH